MRPTLPLSMLLALAAGLGAQDAPAAPELRQLLHEFLAGASRNDAATHERFWAQELIYTGSSGRRISKADIMKDVRETPPARPGEATTVFTAEDVRIQEYGDAALVAFRLVGTTTDAQGQSQVGRYLNTGTFVRRKGQWQAVGWQATRMPQPPDEARQQVLAAQQALHRALLAHDTKALEGLLAEGFVWTDRGGARHTRQELIQQPAAGKLRDSLLETSDPTVSLHGNAALVRGSSCTLTLSDQGEGWKAIALHTSRAE